MAEATNKLKSEVLQADREADKAEASGQKEATKEPRKKTREEACIWRSEFIFER